MKLRPLAPLALLALLLSAVGAHAISFAPQAVAPASESESDWKLTVAPTAWDLGRYPYNDHQVLNSAYQPMTTADLQKIFPNYTYTPGSPTRWSSTRIDFVPKVSALLSAEYRVDERVSLGVWYVPVAWQAKYQGNMAIDIQDTTGAAPKSGLLTGNLSGTSNLKGGMIEVHDTYRLNNGVSVQLGYQRLNYKGTTMLLLPYDTAKTPGVSFDETFNWGTLWGYKTFAVGSEEKPIDLMAGVGITQALDDDTSRTPLNAKTAPTQLNLQVGGAYPLSERYSANVALDGADDPVYLAPNNVYLNMVKEKYPKLQFLEAREVA